MANKSAARKTREGITEHTVLLTYMEGCNLPSDSAVNAAASTGLVQQVYGSKATKVAQTIAKLERYM